MFFYHFRATDDTPTAYVPISERKVVEVIGATMFQDELRFYVKWENAKGIGFLHAKEAHEKYPMLVINYYEKQMKNLKNNKSTKNSN